MIWDHDHGPIVAMHSTGERELTTTFADGCAARETWTKDPESDAWHHDVYWSTPDERLLNAILD